MWCNSYITSHSWPPILVTIDLRSSRSPWCSNYKAEKTQWLSSDCKNECMQFSSIALKFTFFFFFNRHCNPCGFWPVQLSLSILSRKVFTQCRCQWHVKTPTWRLKFTLMYLFLWKDNCTITQHSKLSHFKECIQNKLIMTKSCKSA